MTSPVVPNPQNPAAIDYTNRDFASLRQSLITQAAILLPEWSGAQTGDPNDIGVMLLELLAYEGDMLSYYNDRVANEAYLQTATQRSSVINHARALSYTPSSASSASATVTITVISNTRVTIPARFPVSTTGSSGGQTLVYETQGDLIFEPSTTGISHDVAALEGVTILDEVVAISTGALDQNYLFSRTPVVASSVVIKVVEGPLLGGNAWFSTNNLLDVEGNDNAFAYTLKGNDAFTVHFGDGVNGRVPPRGSVIHASYRVGGGADGNVIANSINTVVNPLDFVYPGGVTPTTLPPAITVTNVAAATGGSDSESLDSIRKNAPLSLRSLERAVSLNDYAVLARGVPQQEITKARAVGSVYSNVTIYVAASHGSQVTQPILNAVVDYFGPRKMAGVTVVAASPTYVGIDIAVSVVVDNRFDQEAVRLSSLSSVQALLNFDNVDFGQKVTVGSVYTAALNHPGVLNVMVSKLARTPLPGATAVSVGANDVLMQPSEIPIIGNPILITATGGVVNSGIYAFSNDGTGTPGVPSVPTIGVLRGDQNSVHVELSWAVGANTTAADVLVEYVSSGGYSSLSTVVGPFQLGLAVFDLPLIGANAPATSIRFTIRAYNNVVGPQPGPSVLVPYLFS